ncbi:MAG: endolytic transglycosylase MltG [Bacteroidales bacterium]|nr:endolytic transglycosylase MltG [Bacteroidales bacterium]
MNLSKYCDEPRKSGNRPPAIPGLDGDLDPKPVRRGKPWLYIGLGLLLLIFAAIVIWPLISARAPHTALIRVPKNANDQMLQDTLTKYLGKDYALSVRKAIPIAGGGARLRHGAWKIEQGMTAVEAARRICKGAQAGIRISFVNERTLDQVATKIAAKYDIPVDSMMAAFNNDKLLAEVRTDREHVIGYFLADTYEFYWTATPEDIIKKMYEHYNRFWSPQRLDYAEQLHMLPREVVVLASIVDEETNQAGEKGTIGRLYINRIQKGMKLQADPTVKYAIGDFSIRRITGDMLNNPSPYNTYRHEGLPPGPIRITSGATIDAILTSRPHGYLYMCAAEDFSGSHNFAVDYESHMANAHRYQQALDQRGIK